MEIDAGESGSMECERPLVSVVIPTYNHATFLKEALESVRMQTYSRWEAIVVNNFSEDDTETVVESFKDDRVKLIAYRNDGVIGASRNVGIRRSRGEFIAFLDSDDLWYAEKLAHCVEALQQGYDLVCHGQVWDFEGGARRQTTFGPVGNATYEKLLFRGNCMSTSATVVRRSILDEIGGFSEDPAFATAEDLELWIRVSEVTDRFRFLPKMLGEYRFHATNESRIREGGLAHMYAVMAVVRHHYYLRSLPSFWDRIRYRARRSRILASGAWRMKQSVDHGQAFRLLGRALMLWPFEWRIYAAGVLTAWNGARRRIDQF